MATEKPTAKRGQTWLRLDRTARVMAVTEGYVVYRFKGSMAHVMHWRDFERNFTLQPNQTKEST